MSGWKGGREGGRTGWWSEVEGGKHMHIWTGVTCGHAVLQSCWLSGAKPISFPCEHVTGRDSGGNHRIPPSASRCVISGGDVSLRCWLLAHVEAGSNIGREGRERWRRRDAEASKDETAIAWSRSLFHQKQC